MPIWDKILKAVDRTLASDANRSGENSPVLRAEHYALVDTEVGLRDHKIHDIGALRYDGAVYHDASQQGLELFLSDVDYLCGHNIVHHDARYLFGNGPCRWQLVDTLYMSPILFPDRPYHKLLKDDKLVSDQANNPVNDCRKAQDLLFDEQSCWARLPEARRQVYATLLVGVPEFEGFMRMVGATPAAGDVTALIRTAYEGCICQQALLDDMCRHQPVALSYALSLIGAADYRSLTPRWVLANYPEVEHIIHTLCATPCREGCAYCNRQLDVHYNLRRFFGYSEFRTYNGEPLQEQAARAAVSGRSLLAIFPTGGGKSLTFQLPALMEARATHSLTVVISPLQSLMKDQVDNLSERGITDAVTINGLLDPISRALAIERVQTGDASLLYIAPEMLRSKTIERILMARHVARFVIDEAHCFSSWGQDFRVDYLYIGQFIRRYQNAKQRRHPIPVSCFTATAKQKVVQDICDYFRNQLGLELDLFASSAIRTNLRYSVIHTDTDEDKYAKLRSLIASAQCPVIVYVSRTKRTRELATRLTRDGYKALPFNGKMDADEKIANQEAFMTDKVSIIVATSAFGMGVDKKDVGLVVHYDISDSLENYVQEAGRAGRDPHLDARCYILYNDNDLDKHFILLNQTKLSISEIQQVWMAVKAFTRKRPRVCCSALEIARQAGWDDSVSDIETRVRTAISALEQSGYVERGNNVPHVYATGITVKNMDEARERIVASALFSGDETEKVVRIIRSLIHQKYTTRGEDQEAESRIDYLADILGLSKREVISAVERMRQEGILADSKDISAYLMDSGDTERKARMQLERFARLERFILDSIQEGTLQTSCKLLNDKAVTEGITTSKEKDVRTLLYFLSIKGYARKTEDAGHNIKVDRTADAETILRRFEKRLYICRFAIEWLYGQAERQALVAEKQTTPTEKTDSITFSVIELMQQMAQGLQELFNQVGTIQIEDVEEALLYLSKIGAIKLEGGFLVLYNAMEIRRIKDSKLRYKIDDYRMLNEFYKQKIQQIHIVGEYANLMVRDYQAALQYVQDYFNMDYRRFIAKYFKGDRVGEIARNLTPAKYHQLFGQLSARQMEIIADRESRCIVVAAGPGSGKTRVLVHKLASLLLLEDVKHEQLLMLTFSRAAATEFKQRLIGLIGNAAHFVEIKTFHSYCFDLLGRIGTLEESDNVVANAAKMICDGEVEPAKIGKAVLVIDEAQDMSADDYALVKALMDNNEEMRVIAVGDDDQNIYEFRGANSHYMQLLAQLPGARFVEMTENYRSARHIVGAANNFVSAIHNRLKQRPIVSMSHDDGQVTVDRYSSAYMYQPLVPEVASHHGEGSTCVLTQTNEEAVIVVAALQRLGVSSELIQSMGGIRFWNLAEVRYFMKHITRGTHTPIVDEEVWDKARQATLAVYSRSHALPYVQRCITLFQQTNPKKYLNDFKEYVFESSIEDFAPPADGRVIVSTIHKAKGREFDNVYMLIANVCRPTDEQLRRFYVGMTRAKRRLAIFTNTALFDRIGADRMSAHLQDYPLPTEVV
ncbi:MAG: RecQ family ATP-dependent DNA helicase, partial [Prevotellaceae bacterium]|nr:RecQ family ATP-dependent DNA helicase [Prevotellaceae bacterium]